MSIVVKHEMTTEAENKKTNARLLEEIR